MKKKLVKSFRRDSYNGKKKESEVVLESANFKIHKMNKRPRPAPENTILIATFSEFGCESLGIMYCIPALIQEYPSKYKIIVGWYGREFLYRHLCDEYWEITEDYMHLREYANAFHHSSKNLRSIELSLKEYGTVFPSEYLGKITIGIKCNNCGLFMNSVYGNGNTWKEENGGKNTCPSCNSSDMPLPMLQDVKGWKKRSLPLPSPSEEKINYVKKYLKKPSVGIFARGRKQYGRNLQPEFYINLIKMLEDMGYNPIWLGEKVSVQSCPVDHVLDWSRMKESRDLESTLAIIKNCEFTIQFWTASTRLSGMIGVPYILFESPDQIWGKKGQEGIRRNLCDLGPRKLAANHFLDVYRNNEEGLSIVKQCIEELNAGNYEDIIGLVGNKKAMWQYKKDNDERIGSNI